MFLGPDNTKGLNHLKALDCVLNVSAQEIDSATDNAAAGGSPQLSSYPDLLLH